MDSTIIGLAVSDALWLIVVTGWIFLIAAGLEADKPLSGGIPGHVNPNEEHNAPAEGIMGRLGIMGGWIVFGLASALLPILLWWIYAVHPR